MRRIPYHLVVLPLLAALFVAFDVLSPFDTRAYDQLMRLQQATPPDEIVLVSIDAESERRYPEFIERRPLALARLVAGQVGQAQQARVARVRAHLVDHGLGHRPLVQGLGAMGCDVPQQPGQLGILQPMPDRPGLALLVVEVGGRDRVLPEVRVRRQQLVQPGADPKALFGQRDGGLEQAGPG